MSFQYKKPALCVLVRKRAGLSHSTLPYCNFSECVGVAPDLKSQKIRPFFYRTVSQATLGVKSLNQQLYITS